GERAPGDTPARGKKTGGAGRGDRREDDADGGGGSFPRVESVLAILFLGPLPPQLRRHFRRGAPLPPGDRQRSQPVGAVSRSGQRDGPVPRSGVTCLSRARTASASRPVCQY